MYMGNKTVWTPLLYYWALYKYLTGDLVSMFVYEQSFSRAYSKFYPLVMSAIVVYDHVVHRMSLHQCTHSTFHTHLFNSLVSISLNWKPFSTWCSTCAPMEWSKCAYMILTSSADDTRNLRKWWSCPINWSLLGPYHIITQFALCPQLMFHLDTGVLTNDPLTYFHWLCNIM